MEQHSSGVNVLIYDHESGWSPIEEAFLEEGKQYDWKTNHPNFKMYIQSIAMPMTKEADGWKGVIEIPFQSGEVQFEFDINNEKISFTSYVYPDRRKLTQDEYNIMLHDILEEASICFQQSGLTVQVKGENIVKKPSMLQWQYIERSIVQLRNIFRKIAEQPMRKLMQTEELSRREQVKQVTQKTIFWLERFGPSYGSTPEKPSEYVQVYKKKESFNVYENQVVLRQILDLQNLLRQYKQSFPHDISVKAGQYYDWLNHWKRQMFLKEVQPATGSIRITQGFRKHPIYGLWFNWFYNLYLFKDLTFDMQYDLALKDTFALYEMWCYIQVVNCLRELNVLDDTSSLFVFKDEQYFLHLKENHGSHIRLIDGSMLSFQKVIQSNSNPYYSYTQRMIPDIVIEKEGSLYILDPKYRLNANVHLALGEMHKYRDGILNKETDEKVVKEVYILTPQQAEMSEVKDFYSTDFHNRYKMGAFYMKPGKENVIIKKWLAHIFEV